MDRKTSQERSQLHRRINEIITEFSPLNNDLIIELEKLLNEFLSYDDTKSVRHYLNLLHSKNFDETWSTVKIVCTEEAVHAAKRICDYAEQLTNPKIHASYIVLFCLIVGQFAEIEFLVLATKINGIKDGEWLGTETSLASALSALANGFQSLGFAHEAYRYSLRAVSLMRKSDDISLKAGAVHTLAIVAFEAGDHQEAEQWYYEALELAEKSNNSRRVALIKLNLAKLLYFFRREYSKSLELIHSAVEFFQEIKDFNLTQDCYLELGQIYTYLNNKELAFAYTNKAVQISEEMRNPRSIMYTLCNLGFVYGHFKEYSGGIFPLNKVLEIAEETPNPIFERKAYYLLYQIYYALGNYQKGYCLLLHYAEITSVLRDEATARSASRHKALFEVEKAHYENQLLRIKSQKLEQEIELKTKELTTLALQIAQKNELLNMLLNDLDKNLGEIQNIRDIRSQIISNMNTERSWDLFEKQFKLVHFDFIERLSKTYPSLSPGELKVCALMRINLSSKEMSNLLCQSERSIETYRYRIRKKFNLTPDKNLVSFLSRL